MHLSLWFTFNYELNGYDKILKFRLQYCCCSNDFSYINHNKILQVGHVASSDWQASVHGTHAERNEDPDDTRVEETRADEAACAPSARIPGSRRTPQDAWRDLTGGNLGPAACVRSGRHVAVQLVRGSSARLAASRLGSAS